MKIKQVCQITDLTDRAVRYYIEEELIFPDYTENYLGRRTFDFCEGDIKMLNNIAILRKFGFTVEEIRRMQLDPQAIDSTVEVLKARKREAIDTESDLLVRLEQYEKGADLDSLAEFLASPVKDKNLPKEEGERTAKEAILRVAKAVGVTLLTALPIAMFIIGFLTNVGDYAYPQLRPIMPIPGILSLLPSVAVWVLPKIKLPKKALIRAICLFLCGVMIPLGFLWGNNIYTHYSLTEDIMNYRYLDPECMENRSAAYQNLFPQWARDKNAKYRYYYHSDFGWFYTDDIYAEWTLGQIDFDKEVERVRSIYDGTVWKEVQKGDYTCLFDRSTAPIFEEVESDYNYYIFAYNEKTRTVRYFHCYSAGISGARPYYLDVEW